MPADFSANNVGKTNVVKWITASERDNQLFKIQRSSDGKNFSTIGQLKGGGTTNTPQYYTFTDELPRQGINYYRLQHIESNGNTYFSKAVALNNLGKGAFWVQPTLVQNTLNLVTSDATIREMVELLNHTSVTTRRSYVHALESAKISGSVYASKLLKILYPDALSVDCW